MDSNKKWHRKLLLYIAQSIPHCLGPLTRFKIERLWKLFVVVLNSITEFSRRVPGLFVKVLSR